MGGMETYARALTEELGTTMDVRLTVLPGRPDGRVPAIPALIGFGLRAACGIVFTRRTPEIVHVADMASWPLAFCARLRYPGARIILSAHGTDVSFGVRRGVKASVYRGYLRLGARLLRRATVIANSRATAATTRKFGFSDVVMVPLAAEAVEDIKPAPAQEPTILFAGRLLPMKGCSWFIKNVLPLLPEPLRLEVAGTVWDESEKAALTAPRVRYLGVLDQTALCHAYASATCVIVPNINVASGAFEGFGLVATEAAAAGGIVLASAQAGLRDAVLEGDTGFLLPAEDAKAWADKIMEVANWDNDYRAAFVKKSRSLCRSHFSWQRVARQTVEIYERPPAGAPGKGLDHEP